MDDADSRGFWQQNEWHFLNDEHNTSTNAWRPSNSAANGFHDIPSDHAAPALETPLEQPIEPEQNTARRQHPSIFEQYTAHEAGITPSSTDHDLFDAILNNGTSAIVSLPARQQLESQSTAQTAHGGEAWAGSATYQRRFLPSHRDDWLDPSISQDQLNAIENFQERLFPPESTRGLQQVLSSSPPASSHNQDSDNERNIALFGESEEEEQGEALADRDVGWTMMPANTRRSRSSVVDLTLDSPPQTSVRPASPPKRRGSGDLAAESSRTSKRGRLSEGQVEKADMVEEEQPSAEEALAASQQQEAIRSQQNAQDDESPKRLGQRQCVICMENFTNITATHCGHFFCHECLIRSLMAGEKINANSTGNCPICRKPVSRSTRARKHIIPISFMKKDTFEKNNRARAAGEDHSRRRG